MLKFKVNKTFNKLSFLMKVQPIIHFYVFYCYFTHYYHLLHYNILTDDGRRITAETCIVQ